jgi:integrase
LAKIDSKTARDALTARREPYWAKLSSGFYLGYRRLSVGGTWIARLRDEETGKQTYRSLGVFDERKLATKVYGEAVKAAYEWRDAMQAGVTVHDATVWDACTHYLENIRIEKGETTANDAEGRFRRLVHRKPLAKTSLARLTSRAVSAWLNAQVADIDQDDDDAWRIARASANRNLTALKAALNRAYNDRLVASDAAWKTVKPFRDVQARRGVGGNPFDYLDEERRAALFAVAATDVRLFLQGLFLTFARPGELASCDVQDFSQKHGTLRIRDGKTGERIVTLSTVAVSFFAQQVKGRIGKTPLLVRSNGKRWDKDAWKDPVRAAAIAANLPDDVVAYSMRHAAISEAVAGGMSMALVAMLAGTSEKMIRDHYGHLNHGATRGELDAARIAF